MIQQCSESFLDLVRDRNHWEFELLLNLVFDGLIGALIWPLIKRHHNKHHPHKAVDSMDRSDTEQTCTRVWGDNVPCGSTFRDHPWRICKIFIGQDNIARDMTDSPPHRWSRR